MRNPTAQGAALETLEADGPIGNDDAQATDALQDEEERGAATDEQDEEEDDAASGADDEVDEDGEGRGERPQAARLLANSGRRGIGRFPRKCKLWGPCG